jgi:energy-coupling factor transporter ATP-binding protein EcfA2
MLTIENLSVRVAGRLLLDDASASIATGARVGLVGRNGSGKSTLFRVIAGDHPAEHGRITLPPRWRIGRLAQEAPDGPESLIDIVLQADTERARLARRHWCACGAGARRLNPLRPWLHSRRPATPLCGILRRLAHAGGACRNIVCRARAPAARRANQLS